MTSSEPREEAKAIQQRWLDDPDWAAIGSWGSRSEELLNKYIAEGLAAAHARGREEGLEEAAKIVEDKEVNFFFQRSPDMIRQIIAAAIRALSRHS